MALMQHASATPSADVQSRRAAKKLSKKNAKKLRAAHAAAAANLSEVPTSTVEINIETPTNTTIDAPSSSSSSSISMTEPAVESAAEPAVLYTPAEQKMVDTIQSVSQKIDQFARELPTIQGQIRNLLARLMLFKWRRNAEATPFTFDAEKLNRSYKTLYYSAGMVDENVLLQIFRLDSILTENDSIRKLRKATVLKGNGVIKQSMDIRKGMEKMKRFLPAWNPVEKSADTPMEDVAPATTNSQAAKDAESDEEKRMQSSDDEDEDDDEKMHDVPAPTERAATPPVVAAAAAAPAVVSKNPFASKYAQFHLPTYAGPQFVARVHPHSGSLMIESSMAGISPSDVTVLPDAANRRVTIHGVRLPERRAVQSFGFFGHAPQRAVQPHGFFTKMIDLNQCDPHALLDVDALTATVDPYQQQLTINVPRRTTVKVAASKPAYQQYQQRRPVQHSSGYYNSSDEEDQPDEYSRPFASHPFSYQPQPRSAHPFFGRSGFW